MTSPQTPKDVAHPPRCWATRYKNFQDESQYLHSYGSLDAALRLVSSQAEIIPMLSVAEHEETVSTLLEALKQIAFLDGDPSKPVVDISRNFAVAAFRKQVHIAKVAIAKASKERT